ncbi:hypothetical protein UCREL1_9542 [Eutypa lata UCREL1]|uniref:Uncharacterized protein n=1 Tax=Eutypa lata (strain UCR-EL1) TaxID=1287681 RepID=M7SH68_EUTLA|nr:hypothetical protein UCREL1_9542 [Eutypa lata UCREL1]
MSRLSTLSAVESLQRSGSALSNVSATTYHSFQDIELYEPGQSGTPYQDSSILPLGDDGLNPAPKTGGDGQREEPRLRRHDSGRLEYAAIDAASQGVKGWFLKHVVPDCFVPKENRRVGFDDDSGSVRRYRLELECEEADEKNARRGKKMGWLFGR